VLIREEPGLLGLPEDAVEKEPGRILGEETVSVLGESRVVPHRFVDREAHKPAEEEVVIELLDQEPLASNGVEDLEEEGAEELFRGDPRPADVRVDRPEQEVHIGKGLVHHRPDPAKRVSLRNAGLRGHAAKEPFLLHILSAHAPLPMKDTKKTIRSLLPDGERNARGFSTAC
jgi:hypothetical protein